MHVGEDAKAKREEEEEEEEEVLEEEEEEEEGGSGEKARAGPQLLPTSQPALSPELKGMLGEAERQTGTMPHPAAPTTDRKVLKEWITAATLHCRRCKENWRTAATQDVS